MSRRAATVALMETQRPPNWLYLDDSDHKEIGIRRATTTDWVMRCSCARCPSWVRHGQPTWYKENPVLSGGEALAPAAASRLRQVYEGTLGAFQFLEPPIQLLSRSRRKPIAGSCDIQKPAVLVAPEDQGV